MEKKIKILYVDDEPINLMLFSALFSNKYEVVESGSGFDALRLLEEDRGIQVVISDMKMHQMNGIEFITRAKKIYPDLHYYILSGYELTREIQEALDTGLIIKYFQKPFVMNVIDRAIMEKFTVSSKE